MSVGGCLLVSLVETGDVLLYHKLGLVDPLFFGDETPLWEFVREHVDKYHGLPKTETLKATFPSLPEPIEPAQFYFDKVQERFTHRTVNKALVECQSHMKEQDCFTALNVMMETISQVRSINLKKSIAEFTQEALPLFTAAYEKKQLDYGDVGILSGWPSLDSKSGGMRGGDIVSIIGRPAMGKTQSVLWMANNALVSQQKKVMVVSMEMALGAILDRQVAIHTHYPLTHVHMGELDTAQQKGIKAILTEAKNLPGKMWVLDGNITSTVEDVYSLVYQFNPDVLFIDGAYLMRHKDTRLNKFQRADANIEELKRRGSDFGIPTILSYQFNRKAVEKYKKSQGKEKGGLEDIYGTDTIGQISSVVLGMFEEESIETLIGRQIEILKDRYGGKGMFGIFWDFLSMNFGEIPSQFEQKKTLQFV